MEIFANLTTCPVCNNVYNAGNHSSCPFCAGSTAGTGSFAPTEAPDGATTSENRGIGGFAPTEAPNAARPMAVQPINATEPVHKAAYVRQGSEADLGQHTVSVDQLESKNGAPSIEPVVGWLVCVEGAMRGNDYRIHSGYNYIGREIGDIHIRGDQTISRQRHARIAYDPTTHQYFFGPDEGRNLLRVNGKTIMVPVELNNYDILTIGQTKLMFVGLCGDHFSWGQG